MATPDRVYTLDPTRLGALRERSGGEAPKDALTSSELTAGSQVVFCRCHAPHLLASWELLGGHCCCRAAAPERMPFPDAEGAPRIRAIRRIFARPRPLEPRPIVPMERRVLDAAVTAGILLALTFAAQYALGSLWTYTNNLHARSLGDLLYNLCVLAVVVALTVASWVGILVVIFTLIWLVINVFANQQDYRDPLATVWDTAWAWLATMADRLFEALRRNLGVP